VIAKLKNLAYTIRGWSTNQKIVVFESDDWGTIRMASKTAKVKLTKDIGQADNNPFNELDILESSNDFDALFTVLEKFKDKNNRPPIITANTIMANPDFSKIKASAFEAYHYELFTETYRKYWPTNETFKYFQKGIERRYLQPQFHGREHVNVQQWLKGLRSGNNTILKAFDQQVFGLDFKVPNAKRPNFMATYDVEALPDLNEVNAAIVDGLSLFTKTFGFSSRSSVAPAVVWHPDTELVLANAGVKFLQGYIIQNVPTIGGRTYLKEYHYHGERNKYQQKYLVRNCYFEPSTNRNMDWVDKCLSQISNAFLFKKPAIISTHRINFVGGIEERNRTENMKQLNNLLKSILLKWPDVEFMSSDELGTLMNVSKNQNN
jgi:hypothetical protein